MVLCLPHALSMVPAESEYRMAKLLAAVLALQLAVAPRSAGDVYVVEGTRSEAKFEIRYLTTVAGRLRDIIG